MQLFAPGTWQGINAGMADIRQQQSDQLQQAYMRQQMAQQAFNFEQQKQQQVQQQALARQLGQAIAPPQTPEPGQPSVPMVQPQQARPPMLGVPPYQTVDSVQQQRIPKIDIGRTLTPPKVEDNGVLPQGQLPPIEQVLSKIDPQYRMAAMEQLRPLYAMQQQDQYRKMQEELMLKRIEAIDKNLAKPVAGASGVTEYPKDVVDAYAQMTLLGYNSWRTGLPRTKQGSDLILAVDKRIPSLMKEKGMSGQDVIGAVAERTASVGALNQITKDLAALRPYKVMLDTNIDIAKELGQKVVSTNSAYANRSLNWIKQNLGDNPDTSEFLAQMHFVASEAARVLDNPRLVGTMAVSTREAMEGIVSGNLPLGASVRVLDRIKKDGLNRIAALEAEQKNLTKGAKGEGVSGARSSAISSDDEALINKYLK